MKRQSTGLADGRELIYFDDSDDAVRELVDPRDLPPMPPASQLRYDALTDEWVAVASENEHWTAFTPAAARWPFEVLVASRRVMADLTGLTESEAAAFAPVYLDVRKRLDALFGVEMPYISAWRQAPAHAGREVSCLFLQLFSIRRDRTKLKYLAGSESAMGAFVNDIVPEQAARMLREAA